MSKEISVASLKNVLDKHFPFNSQVTLSISGAANAGIDKIAAHRIFRFDIPPSIKDRVKEEGRAGRRVEANSATD